MISEESVEADDGWGGLAAVGVDADDSPSSNPYAEGDQDEIIPEEDLPFTRFRPPPEEEDPESIRTGMRIFRVKLRIHC